MAKNVDLYSPSKYFRRKRTYEMPDGSKIEVLTSRYTYKYFHKPYQGPRGGKRYKTLARALYYKDGKMYKAANFEVAPKEYINTIALFDGTAWDCHEEQTRKQGMGVYKLECVEGIVTQVFDGDEIVWDYFDNSVEELEELLDLAPVSQKDRKRAEEKARKEAEKVADLPVAADNARRTPHKSVTVDPLAGIAASLKSADDALLALNGSVYVDLATAAVEVARAALANDCTAFELPDVIEYLEETIAAYRRSNS